MTDTYISGCGVLPDTPLGEGTRLRLSPTGNPSEDVEVYVENGQIHLVGHYVMLYDRHIQDNHVVVTPINLVGVR